VTTIKPKGLQLSFSSCSLGLTAHSLFPPQQQRQMVDDLLQVFSSSENLYGPNKAADMRPWETPAVTMTLEPTPVCCLPLANTAQEDTRQRKPCGRNRKKRKIAKKIAGKSRRRNKRTKINKPEVAK
jgi:hypothetical protein